MLGPLDGRIRRSRCEACARRRIKCYGGIPCRYCEKTNLNCIPPNNLPSKDAVFVINTLASKDHCSIHPKTAIATVPRSVPFDQQAILVEHFFNFLAANSFASAIIIGQERLKSQFHCSPGLYNAVLAVAALDISNQSRTSGSIFTTNQGASKIVALKAYRASCKAVQEDLQRKDVLDNEATLWSTFVLGFFELMYDNSGTGWLQHMLHGTSRMLQLRGAKRHESGNARAFFLSVRIFEIGRALIFATTTFLAEDKWKCLTRKMWVGAGAKDWHPKEDLYDLMICCTDLTSRVGTHIGQHRRIPLSQPTLLAQAEEGTKIQKALHEWYDKYQSWSPMKSHCHQDIVAKMYYNATIIFLSGIFDYYHYHGWDENTTPTLSCNELQTHVEAILDLSEAGLKTNLAGLLFFFPLRVAGARATSEEDKARILGMLGEISKRAFVVADAFVLDLKEWWKITGNQKVRGASLDLDLYLHVETRSYT